MTDLEKAVKALDGHTIALCKGENIIISDKKGISPMIGFIDDGADLRGYSAADLVVGKAAAMLLVKAGIKEVFAKNLSKSGEEYLEKHGITVKYDVLTDKILNRSGDGICPMECAVSDTEDFDEGYRLIKEKLEVMIKKTK